MKIRSPSSRAGFRAGAIEVTASIAQHEPDPAQLAVPRKFCLVFSGNGGLYYSEIFISEENNLDFGYPRPQLERQQWTNLNGPWRFCFDDNQKFRHPTEIQQWPMTIQVPFPPESKKSGIGDRNFHRICWYQREFHLAPHTGRTILHFGAVDYHARVWVNGREVVTHEGGHTPFSADITSALNPSESKLSPFRWKTIRWI